MDKKAHGYWKTSEGLEEIKRLALLCKTKSEFRKKYNAAYLAAHNQGVLKSVCKHMVQVRREKGYWSSSDGLKEISEKAALCEQKREFEKRFGVQYNAALRLGVIDQVCMHMSSPQLPSGFWGSAEGKAQVNRAASSCKDIKEFRTKFPNEYNGASKWGYLREVCSDLEYVSYPANYWDSEAGIEEMKYCVSQCETLTEFRERYSRAYNSAKKKGLLSNFEDELERQRAHKGYWDTVEGKEEIEERAKSFSTRAAFKYESPEMYLAARRGGFLDEICEHMDYGGGGFNSASSGFFYILLVYLPNFGLELVKIGITNLSARRRYENEKASIVFKHEWEFEVGANARDVETTIKRILKDKKHISRYPILTTGGDSELFEISLDAEINWIERFLEDYGGIKLY